MVNRVQYEASRLDLTGLQDYAKEVARSTKAEPKLSISYDVTEIINKTRIERGFLGLGRPKEIHTPQATTRTVELAGPHWLIDERKWLKTEEWERGDITTEETTEEFYYMVLLRSGELMLVQMSRSSVLSYGRGSPPMRRPEVEGSARLAREEDILKLDLEKKYDSSTWQADGRRHAVRGDRDSGRRLIHSPKGNGVRSALTKILNGT